MFRFLVTVILLVEINAFKNYERHQVWKVSISNTDEQSVLLTLENEGHIDCWTTIKRSLPQTLLLSLSSEAITLVKARFDQEGIAYSIVSSNLQRMIDASSKTKLSRAPGSDMDFNVYHPLEDIHEYTNKLSEKYDFISKREIGHSTAEKIPIELVTYQINKEKRPSVYLDCGIHAREWITVSVCLKLMDNLARRWVEGAPQETHILKKFNIHIVPVYNPEGYNYTWTEDRLWRKNRRENILSSCKGVDLNRNYDVHFGEFGASHLPCSETYCGKKGNSESETQATLKALEEIQPHAYFNIHSYSQLWMYPYGYQEDPPRNAEELDRVARIGVERLTSFYQTPYEIGSKYTVIYPSTGSTIDYIYDNFPSVKYAYTLELRDQGDYGFVLPPELIAPTTKETYEGIMAALKAMK